jgi:hypothetical protein
MLSLARSKPCRLVPRHLARWSRGLLPVVALLLLLGTALPGCSASSAEGQHVAGKPERPFTAADVAHNKQAPMPSYVTADMRDAYQYALAHPDQLQYIPCYCGCELTTNHNSNLACYIAGVDKDGKVVFDNHASFCAICLEITRDVERLSAEGKSLKEIRTYVDQTHSEKGPGTNTPLPPS